MNQTVPLSRKLYIWSTGHALLMLVAVTLAFYFRHTAPLAAAALISFLFLITASRGEWTESGRFGRANTASALRLALILFLTLWGLRLSPALLGLLATGLLFLDGLDGWLARRHGEQSEFGEYLDKETDAFFLLALCLVGFLMNRYGGWVIGLGLLRYLFALFLLLHKSPVRKERRSHLGQVIYIVVMIAVTGAFFPLPYWNPAALLAAALLLTYSFGKDVIWILFKN